MTSKAVLLQAAIIVGALGVPGAVVAENSDGDTPPPTAPAPSQPAEMLEMGLQGEEAIEAAGDQLDEIAADAGMTEEELTEVLTEDENIVLVGEHVEALDPVEDDDHGINDHGINDKGINDHGINPDEAMINPYTSDTGMYSAAAAPGSGATLVTPTSGFPAGAMPALEDAFKLHSRPEANVTLYLDFKNGNLQQFADRFEVFPPFDLDDNPNDFSELERQYVVTWWMATAARLAPFNVDVTTEEPPQSDLDRTSASDERFGGRFSISHTDPTGGGFLGGGPLNLMNRMTDTTYLEHEGQRVELVGRIWTLPLNGNDNANFWRRAADVIIHEIGHMFGLAHDGISGQAYYTGHDNWGPIMGSPGRRAIAQFDKGEYPGALNRQDDFAIIAETAPLAKDDFGKRTALGALNLDTGITGVISKSRDIDGFNVPASNGRIEIRVEPTDSRSTLNPKLTVRDAQGTVIGESDQPGNLAEVVTVDGRAGPFVAVVQGVGEPNQSIGYSDYGSVGPYNVFALAEGELAPVEPVDLPTPDPRCRGQRPTIWGTDGDDTLFGTAGDDVIMGGTGNDTIYGGGGNDILCGSSGNDTIYAGKGDDLLDGGVGHDTLMGEAGDDELHGVWHNDKLFGGPGNDILRGEADSDELHGGSGGDDLDGATGDDVLFGEAGNDYLDGWVGDDRLVGGDGNDTLIGHAGDDRLDGGNGDDMLEAQAGDDELDGGNGNDTMDGGPDNDKLRGGGGNDTMIGHAGIDRLWGAAGADTIYGGPGNDTIYAGRDNDRVLAGQGDDLVYGELGADTLHGENGNDTINGGPGSDSVVGGKGRDRCAAERRATCES